MVSLFCHKSTKTLCFTKDNVKTVIAKVRLKQSHLTKFVQDRLLPASYLAVAKTNMSNLLLDIELFLSHFIINNGIIHHGNDLYTSLNLIAKCVLSDPMIMASNGFFFLLKMPLRMAFLITVSTMLTGNLGLEIISKTTS